MAGISFADNINITLSTNSLAFRTYFFDGRFYFHKFNNNLQSLNYTAFATVWINLNQHFVADQNANSVQTHFTGEIRQYLLVCVVSYDFKKSVWQCLCDTAQNSAVFFT